MLQRNRTYNYVAVNSTDASIKLLGKYYHVIKGEFARTPLNPPPLHTCMLFMWYLNYLDSLRFKHCTSTHA